MLEETKKSLLASPIVKKGEYNYFVNAISDGIPEIKPEVLNELTDAIKKHVNLDVDKIVSIEAMGIHLGTALSLATGIPHLVIRKRQYGLEGEKSVTKKTGYGESTLYINYINSGDKILIIDDVVSTGGTLISLLNALKEYEIDISSVIAIIDKAGGKNTVEKETGVPLFSLVALDVIDGKVVITSTIED